MIQAVATSSLTGAVLFAEVEEKIKGKSTIGECTVCKHSKQQ
jgi:hypothetical protein